MRSASFAVASRKLPSRGLHTCKVALATGVLGGASAVVWLQWNFRGNDDPPLPRDSSVVVIGAGLAGVSTAHALALSGYRVRLIDERLSAGEGCSGGNAGTLGISAPARRLSTPSFFLKAPIWLCRAPTADGPPDNNRFTHRSTFLEPCFWLWGVAYLRLLLSHTTDKIPHEKDWERRNRDEVDAIDQASSHEGLSPFVVQGRLIPVFGAPVAGSYTASSVGGKLLTPHECLKYEPCLQEAVEAGLVSEGHWFAVDGHGDCKSYLRRLVTVLRERHQVQVEFGVPCRRLLVSGGKCFGVELASGERVEADAVVLANGSGAAPLAATAWLFMPVQALRGYSFTVPVRLDGAAAPRASIVTQPHEMYITRVQDADLGDSVRFAAFGEIAANWLSEPTPVMLERLEKLVRMCMPNVEEFCDWDKRKGWVGARPLSPDSNPIVGPTRVSGLYVNLGHSFNGWRVSAVSGMLCANGFAHGWDSNGRYNVLYSPQRFLPWRRAASQCHEVLPQLAELLPWR